MITDLNGDTMNYRELICIDANKKDLDFSLEKLELYINEIIDENQYNIENYKKLIERNTNLQKEVYKLTDENKTLQNHNEKLQKQINKLTPTAEENKFKTHNRIETLGGYSLFAFKYDNIRYKIGLCKTSTLEIRQKVYKASHSNCQLKLNIQIKHPFLEKNNVIFIKTTFNFFK